MNPILGGGPWCRERNLKRRHTVLTDQTTLQERLEQSQEWTSDGQDHAQRGLLSYANHMPCLCLNFMLVFLRWTLGALAPIAQYYFNWAEMCYNCGCCICLFM